MRQHRERDLASDQLRIAAIHAVAEHVQAARADEDRELAARIDARLLHVDPLRQGWNVFRCFGVEADLASWRKWLAAILRPDTGAWCARVVWNALCDAIARRAPDPGPWEAAATDAPEVSDDLRIICPSLVTALHLELWPEDAAPPPPHPNLVVLSHRTKGDGAIYISWRDLGQALRRILHREWSDDPQNMLELWPIILTLISIEQDLLDFEPSELASYLEER